MKPVRKNVVNSVLGAALAVSCGIALWQLPVGDGLVNASYDSLFRFGSHSVTNRVVFIAMDNEAYDEFHQTRGQPWDRKLHAQLLNKLADDGCALVVFDVFFRNPQSPEADEALAQAMRRQSNRGVILLSKQTEVSHPTLDAARPMLPIEPLLTAAGGNWGVGWVNPDADEVVRHDWPNPSPGPFPGLSETAAKLAGNNNQIPSGERWLRYYAREGAWTKLSYKYAMVERANYFRDCIVFIGEEPQTSLADGEAEEFRTPFTKRTGTSASGAEIMMTSFLNLVNGDSLRRPAKWLEGLLIALAGAAIGGWLCRLRMVVAGLTALAVGVVVALAAIVLSYRTNYWFPWLIVVGAQVPASFAWAVATRKLLRPKTIEEPSSIPAPVVSIPAVATPAILPPHAMANAPEAPDYEIVNPPFGRGAYGKVWLVRNAVGQWQALKAVYLEQFDNNPDPYDREFSGISRYKPISDKHPGLLRVDFVSRKRENYFYYVMELGDPLEPGWEKEPSSYKPRDLVSERARLKGRRLPIEECVRIGLSLSDALEFLHGQGLTHRDIKPQNIIYVNGQPKLADVGLIGRMRASDEGATAVGTPGYMPPQPEPLGTAQADIYALGMMLYVLSTGQNPAFFPELATTLVESNGRREFLPLNEVILKACHPDRARRFASASELYRALSRVQRLLNGDTTSHRVLMNEFQS